jgi:blue light- and temperature-responsive anti-repressor
MSDLYRLVYASKNLFTGAEDDVAAAVSQILDVSKRNNLRVGVTGALMFNADVFAQVLEGPRRGVEETFERIQRDTRHGDVTVLQCGPVESRGFAGWSMAFVGRPVVGQARFHSLAAESGFDLARLSGDSVFAILHELVLDEEGVSGSNIGLPHGPEVEECGSSVLDVEQVRAEIAQLRPSAPSAPAVPAAQVQRRVPEGTTGAAFPHSMGVEPSSEAAVTAAVAVLKAALISERQQTTELRSEIDELQVALAANQDRLGTMREERNRWAERARLLAKPMFDDVNNVLSINQSLERWRLQSEYVASDRNLTLGTRS